MNPSGKRHKHPPLVRASWSDDITAPVHGLVLAGGHSKRMGVDKGALDYHGKPHREYTADQVAKFSTKTFLSCRAEQQGEIETMYETIPDTFVGLGPYGAILSAFRYNPNVAWLVAACDLPMLDRATLEHLVSKRDPQRFATAFRNNQDGLPEPLIAIWEPRSYAVLLNALGQGRCCPRKVLIHENVKLLDPLNPDALINANTPEDSERFQKQKGN